MNNCILKIEDLSHSYNNGKQWAIKDINFEISSNGIIGLLGSNGAGKSTTMNIMCGVINQTKGNVYIDGINIRKNPVEAKRLIGFLPQKAPLFFELTVDEYLRYCANLRDINEEDIDHAIEIAKEKCGIAHFSNRLISNLSGGYQQRVGIAQAIIHNPKLVVLDEPTNGLDPNQIREVRSLIKDIAKERTVILSTHILPEVQATCDDIIMIEHGIIVFKDTLEAFDNYINPNIILMRVNNIIDSDDVLSVEGVNSVELVEDKNIRIQYDHKINGVKNLIQASISNEWDLQEIYFEKSSLDDVFAELSKKN